MQCPSLSLIIVLILKTILSDMRIATLICMEYVFLSPHFQSACVPKSEMGLL